MPLLTRLTLAPGQSGTKKLTKKYGDKLVCVRYRYDPQNRKRYKTVELIEDIKDWEPNYRLQYKPDDWVPIKINYNELQLRKAVKNAGGRWNAQKVYWLLPYIRVEKLKLQKRIIPI